MVGSSRRRAALQRRLQRGMWLLLPADPGQAAMLDAVRQLSPGAKRILPHRIQVDGRSQFYLSRGYPVDAETRRAAGLPRDINVAYFLKWVADSEADAARYREQGARVLAGLAARFGGACWPSPGRGAADADALDGMGGLPRSDKAIGAGRAEKVGEASGVGGARRGDTGVGEVDGGGTGVGEVDGGGMGIGGVDEGDTVVDGMGGGNAGVDGIGGWRRVVLRVGLVGLCAVVFFGFAADDGTAAKWPLMAVNALMGLFFAAATGLLAWRHLGRGGVEGRGRSRSL